MKRLNLLLTVALVLTMCSVAQANVTISLNPENPTVNPGDIFTVDVVLDNSALDPIWGMGIWLKYDSDLLNVIDYDTGNWVTDGINILDGPYHDPFNYPGESYAPNVNDADTDGEIWWNVAESDAQWEDSQTPSGIFATIQFQAEGPLGTADLWFDGPHTGGSPDTFVLSKDTGMNIMDSASGGSINIVPEPGSFILFGIGVSLIGMVGFIRRKKK